MTFSTFMAIYCSGLVVFGLIAGWLVERENGNDDDMADMLGWVMAWPFVMFFCLLLSPMAVVFAVMWIGRHMSRAVSK